MKSIQQALKLLSEKQILSPDTAQKLYHKICKKLGLNPTSITLPGAPKTAVDIQISTITDKNSP